MTEKDRKPEGGFRLDKYLADMKAGSRSEVKVMIRKGRVSVNGAIVCDAGYKVLKNDTVLLDGKSFEYASVEYIMLNKPAGILSATKDKKQKTVLDLVCDARRKDLFPVGRLDRDTEGLLLLTNDGALAHGLLSPKKHIDKVYFARVYGKVTECEVLKFQQGLLLKQDLVSESGKEFFSLPAKLEILGFQPDTSKENIDRTEIYLLNHLRQTRILQLSHGFLHRILHLKPQHILGACQLYSHRCFTPYVVLRNRGETPTSAFSPPPPRYGTGARPPGPGSGCKAAETEGLRSNNDIRRNYNAVLALLFSSFLFAFIGHMGEDIVDNLLYRLPLGVLFCSIKIKFKKLIYPTMVHAMYNIYISIM